MDFSGYPTFLAASAILILTPGPAVLYIVNQSVSQGRAFGVASSMGVCAGNLIHAVFAATGLSAILATSTLLFSIVKYAGAAYLIYLGLRKLLTKPAQSAAVETRTGRPWSVFAQGVVVAILNPKTALFFLAFLPQFVVSEGGPVWAQLLSLGIIFCAMAAVSDTGFALLSGRISQWLRRGSAPKYERYVSGAIYCSLGLMAAVSAPTKTS